MRRPLFAALAGIAAAVWITIVLFPWDPPDYEPYRKRQVCLTGTVCGLEPRREGSEIVWRMMLSELEWGKSPDSGNTEVPIPLPGKRSRVLCVLDCEPPVEMSARVRVTGTMTPFRPAYNEGEFDLRLYEHILRVAFSLRDTEILAVSTPSDHVAASLYHLKKFISNVIDRDFSNQNSPVLQAMLLGEKGLLEEETKTLYQGAGIIHILSISGMHLSLLGMGLFSLCRKLRMPIQLCAGLSITLIFLYGKMIGMGTSAFRALVMMVLFIISIMIGRTYDLLTASGIACILLLFEQPLYLLHTGFQFSFAAVLSMGILMPALPAQQRLLPSYGERKSLRTRIREFARRLMPDGPLRTLAVPAGTLPVYLWAYGTFPVWSLLLNLIVIPLMAVVMASAGCALIPGCILSLCERETGGVSAGYVRAGGLSSSTARADGLLPVLLKTVIKITAFPVERILDLYRLLAKWSQTLPGRALVIGRPSQWQIILYYIMLVLMAAVSDRLQMPDARRRVESAAVAGQCENRVSAAAAGKLNNKIRRFSRFDRFLKALTIKIHYLHRMPEHLAIDLCLYLKLRDNRARRRFGTLCCILWMAVSVLVLTARRPPQFEMDVLYVGQGDGICIQCEGRTFMIDGGSTTKDQLAKYTLVPYLHCRGIRKLDGVILTHDDADHCSGLIELLEALVTGKTEEEDVNEADMASVKTAGSAGEASTAMGETAKCTHEANTAQYISASGKTDDVGSGNVSHEGSSLTDPVPIGAIYLPDIAVESRGYNYKKIELLAKQAGIPVAYISRGQRIRAGSLNLDCLHPARGAAYEDANSYSTTLLLRYRDFSALLTGDLEKEGEEDMLKYIQGLHQNDQQALHRNNLQKSHQTHIQKQIQVQDPLQQQFMPLHIDVLKVAHHGSRNATSEEFLKYVDPEIAVISAGAGNMYGHPHRELLDRLSGNGIPCERTDRRGEIMICPRKGVIRIKTFFQQSDQKGLFRERKMNRINQFYILQH